jgi:hypothetical protein
MRGCLVIFFCPRCVVLPFGPDHPSSIRFSPVLLIRAISGLVSVAGIGNHLKVSSLGDGGGGWLLFVAHDVSLPFGPDRSFSNRSSQPDTTSSRPFPVNTLPPSMYW